MNPNRQPRVIALTLSKCLLAFAISGLIHITSIADQPNAASQPTTKPTPSGDKGPEVIHLTIRVPPQHSIASRRRIRDPHR